MVLIYRQLNNVEQTLFHFNIAIAFTVITIDAFALTVGGRYELIDAVGLVVFGHLSIDGLHGQLLYIRI